MKTLKNKENKRCITIKLKKLKRFYKNINNSNMNGGTMNYKEDYISILKELEYYNRIYEKEHFKAKKYRDAIETINNYNSEITSSEDIKDLPGIGKAITEKLDEYIKHGKVKNLEELKKEYGTEDYKAYKIKQQKKEVFLQIHGIGDAAAEKILELGISTIDELKKRKDELIPGKGKNKLKLLNDIQQKGLVYYEETKERIPRQEIIEYENLLKQVFINTINENAEDVNAHKFEIVGSYRRGKPDSGDIDIIVTSNNNNKTIYDKFLKNLHKNNIIEEFLSNGDKKSMVIGRLTKQSKARRLDFLYTPPDEYAFAILYFTGSKEFNTAMRQHALNNNLTLNEHGFHKMDNKIKGAKIVSTNFNNEKDIFDYLNLEFKEPNERIDENCIILKEKSAQSSVEYKDTLKIKLPKKSKNTTIKNNATKNITNNIDKFKSQGIDILQSLSEDELTEMLKLINKTYYDSDSEPLLTDNEYDILREYVLEKYPNNKIALEQHTEVKLEKTKVKLPYEMWSMDKIKADTKELDKFKKKYNGPYVISCKLDGVSALYSTEEGKGKLYTRGDGKYGQSIDHLIEYIELPNMETEKITLRGELIIKENLFKEKYSNKYSNSRNFISGIVNKKKLSKDDINILKDIDFVVYEVIKPDNLKPSVQLNIIKELNFKCVKFMRNITSEELTNEKLSEKLIDWRNNYEYTIDGIICIDDKVYPRESKNPEHAFAFKMVLSDQSAEAKVLDVLWSASKDGLLKPRVKIEEVNIGGAKINYATGFNAKFIQDNKIGLGAVIKIIRSGDVIPKIEEVITPATSAIMPKEKYIWNETHVDIMLENKENDDTVRLKNIAGFFKAIEVDGLGEANIKKIIKIGGNSIGKIIGMSIQDFMEVEGFREKMATKIHNSIQKQIDKCSLVKLAAASNIFGRGLGEKKIELILENEPDILNSDLSKLEKINKLKLIDGLGDKTSMQFVEKIDEFKKFIVDGKLEYKLNKKVSSNKVNSPKENLPLSGKIIVLSDIKGKKELSEKILKLGGLVESNITKNVNLLIVGNIDDETSKMKKAKEYNIEIISLDEFNNYK